MTTPAPPVGQPVRGSKPAPEATAGLKLSPAAQLLVRPDITGAELFDRLVQAKLFPDAVRLIAREMVPGEAVWWGVLCIWATARPQPAPKADAGLRSLVKWLREPSDAHRRGVGEAVKALGPDTPGGLVARAAYMAGGNMAPEGRPVVAADPFLATKLVAEAILALSRAAGPLPSGGPLVRQFLATAVDVIRGTNTPHGKN